MGGGGGVRGKKSYFTLISIDNFISADCYQFLVKEKKNFSNYWQTGWFSKNYLWAAVSWKTVFAP